MEETALRIEGAYAYVRMSTVSFVVNARGFVWGK